MPSREKAQVHFMWAYNTTGFIYIVLSALLAVYLGCRVKSPVTQNFAVRA